MRAMCGASGNRADLSADKERLGFRGTLGKRREGKFEKWTLTRAGGAASPCQESFA